MSIKKTKKNKARKSQNNNYSMHMGRSKIEKLVRKKRAAEKVNDEESLLTSPTSLSMKNSFLIQSIGKTFDGYYGKKNKKRLEVSTIRIV